VQDSCRVPDAGLTKCIGAEGCNKVGAECRAHGAKCRQDAGSGCCVQGATVHAVQQVGQQEEAGRSLGTPCQTSEHGYPETQMGGRCSIQHHGPGRYKQAMALPEAAASGEATTSCEAGVEVSFVASTRDRAIAVSRISTLLR
jgi:hypothetical protein